MADVAKQRRPVLMCVFMFDIAIYLFRISFYGVNPAHSGFRGRLSTIMPQLLNMIALHSIVGWVNWRSRRQGQRCDQQQQVNPGSCLLREQRRCCAAAMESLEWSLKSFACADR